MPAVLPHCPLTAQAGEIETQNIELWGLNELLAPLLAALSAELAGSLLEVLKLNGKWRLFVRLPWCLPGVYVGQVALTFLCCLHLHGSLWATDRTNGGPIRFYP